MISFLLLAFVANSVVLNDHVYNHKTATFGPRPGEYDVVAKSELVSPIDGCGDLGNLTGRIALIQRGGTECYFINKAFAAQNAGAIGMIVGAIKSDTKLIQMYAKETPEMNPDDIDIPCVFVEKNSFDALAAAAGETVTLNNDGESSQYFPPIEWDTAFRFLLVLPIIFIATCLVYFIFQQAKRFFNAVRRTENARRLPTIRFKMNEIHNNGCCICIEDFEDGEQIKVLPCGHGYHVPCIDQWLTDHSDLCPMCKRSIMSESIHSVHGNAQNQWCSCCPEFRRPRFLSVQDPGPNLLSDQDLEGPHLDPVQAV